MKVVLGLAVAVLMTCGVFALPLDDPAASAAAPAIPPGVVEEVIAAPEVAVAPAPVAPVQPAVAPAPAPAQNSQGGGFISEHKNPDGSTITITRFNGPIPSSAFNSFGQIQQQIFDSHLHNLAQAQNYHNLHVFNHRLAYPSYNNFHPNFPHLYQPFLNQQRFGYTNYVNAGGSPFGTPFASPYFFPTWGYPSQINLPTRQRPA